MTDLMTKLFHLFELDRLKLTGASVDIETLVALVDGIAGEFDYSSNLFKEHKIFISSYPERMWKLVGKDFILDIYDKGNGWFQVKKVEVCQ